MKYSFAFFSVLLLICAPTVLQASDGKTISSLGVTQSYGDGFFNVRIEGNRIKVIFMDEEREVVSPPYPEAYVRYEYRVDPRGLAGFKPQYTDVLKQQGDALVGNRNIPPPHNMYIYITLREPASKEETQQTYTGVYNALSKQKAKRKKIEALPRIHLNQLPPVKEESTHQKIKTTSASSGKKYTLRSV